MTKPGNPLRGPLQALHSAVVSELSARELVRLLPVTLPTIDPNLTPEAIHERTRAGLRWYRHSRRANAEMLGPHRVHETRNGEVLERLRTAGRSAMVTSLHLGPFFFVTSELCDLGHPVSCFAASSTREMWEGEWNRKIERSGWQLEMLPSDKPSSLLRAARRLDQRGLLVVYLDPLAAASPPAQNSAGRAIRIDFLGAPLWVRTAPFRILARRGAELIAAACTVDAAGRRILDLSDPLRPPRDESLPELERAIRDCLDWLGARVVAQPEQWVGTYQRPLNWLNDQTPPRALADALARLASDLAEAERGNQGTLRVEASEVCALVFQPWSFLIHGPSHRVLRVDDAVARITRSATPEAPLRKLRRASRLDPEAFAMEAARLVLAGLARFEPHR